jgi:hypothetical protein
LFESNGVKNFNFVPLTTSYIPGFTTIDTTALGKMFLGYTSRTMPKGILDDDVKLPLWEEFMNLNRKVFSV